LLFVKVSHAMKECNKEIHFALPFWQKTLMMLIRSNLALYGL
jgi:hypothetical protein